jgi:hypothetical protein
MPTRDLVSPEPMMRPNGSSLGHDCLVGWRGGLTGMTHSRPQACCFPKVGSLLLADQWRSDGRWTTMMLFLL